MNSLTPSNQSKDLSNFTTDQIDLIKRTICSGASDDELKLFLHVASKNGLDPFSRQIHAVFRFDKNSPTGKKMTIQTGIDGYRLIADRTGKYAGNEDPVFEFDTTKKMHPYPVKATVTVYKIVGGVRCPFTATAYWDEYYPGDGPQGAIWRQRPKGQLGKCAEALALRKAFPAELSGIYTGEEMEQAIREEERQIKETVIIDNAREQDFKVQEEILEKIQAESARITNGLTLTEKGLFMQQTLGVSKFDELKLKTNRELSEILSKIKDMKSNAPIEAEIVSKGDDED